MIFQSTWYKFFGTKICVAQIFCNLSYLIGIWQDHQKTLELKILTTCIGVNFLDLVRNLASARPM